MTRLPRTSCLALALAALLAGCSESHVAVPPACDESAPSLVLDRMGCVEVVVDVSGALRCHGDEGDATTRARVFNGSGSHAALRIELAAEPRVMPGYYEVRPVYCTCETGTFDATGPHAGECLGALRMAPGENRELALAGVGNSYRLRLCTIESDARAACE